MSNKFHKVAIVNLTPDSFSDGGETFSKLNVEHKIKNLFNSGITIFDIGAQSTAPKSKCISMGEEIQRFSSLLIPLLRDETFKNIFSNCHLSVDTYRVDTFMYIKNELHI